MPKITPLHPSATITYRYQNGDISSALFLGTQNAFTAQEIETTFHDLLFLPADAEERDAAVWMAREVLMGLVEALRPHSEQEPQP